MGSRLILFEDFPAQAFVRPRLALPPGTLAQSLREFLGLKNLAEAEKEFEAGLVRENPKEACRLSVTLRELNAALLETEDEQDFFFSCLTPKKAQLLKDHFGRYLAITGELFRAVATLPKKIELLDPEIEVFLVPHGATPSRFMEECSRKFASHLPKHVQLATWEEACRGEEMGALKRPLVVEAVSASLYFTLSQRVKRAAKTGDVAIAFLGSAADRQGLKLAMARLGLTLDESLNADEKAVTAPPTVWQKIRQARAVAWARRLGIERQWRELSETQESEEPFAKQLKDAELISEEEAAALDVVAVSAPEKTARIGLLPFQAYPPLRQTTVFYFFDSAVNPNYALQTDERSLLSTWEKERLWDSGFPVGAAPSPSLASLLTQAAQEGQRPLFFCKGKNEVPEFKRSALALLPDSTYRGHWETAKFEAPAVFSASQLSAFEGCPANYLFSRRLKLQPQEKIWQKSALIYGSLAHSTLEKWIALSERSSQAAVELFNAQMEEKFPKLQAAHPLRVSLNEAFGELAIGLPQLEGQLNALFGAHEILELEAPFRIDRFGASFTGRMDRVDKLSDGSLLVIDYKTGNVDFTPDHVTDGRDHQVALYLWAAEQKYRAPVSAFLYYDLKKKELRRGLVKKERLTPEGVKLLTRGHAVDEKKWNELLGLSEAHLKSVLTEFNLGAWRPKPGPVCDSCSYLTLCRRGKVWQS